MLCNGNVDCRDKSDEDPGFCRGALIMNCLMSVFLR